MSSSDYIRQICESASAGVYLTQVSAPEGKTLKLALDCLRSLKRVG